MAIGSIKYFLLLKGFSPLGLEDISNLGPKASPFKVSKSPNKGFPIRVGEGSSLNPFGPLGGGPSFKSGELSRPGFS